MFLDIFIPAFVTFFVAIDPPGVAPIFAGLAEGRDSAFKRRMALQSVFAALVILVIFAFAGEPLLSNLGITLDAFRVAGGVLLLLIAVDMVFEKQTKRRRARADKFSEQHADEEDFSIFPMAVPMIAGPGAITALLLFMGNYAGDALAQGIVIGTLVSVLLLTFVCLIGAAKITEWVGPAVTAAFTRVLGIILAALAIQYIFDGVSAFLNA